jgi:hypothetical protein
MKHNIIKTDNYLLIVDDSEIKEGDLLWSFSNEKIVVARKVTDLYIHSKKIIAHLPLNNSPILEGVDLLPPLEQDDVEKMAKEDAIEIFGNDFSLASLSHQSQFKRGYNKAKEKYLREIDKQISDFKHDLKECTSNYIKQNCEGAIFGLTRLQQSLPQPKIPTHFQFEMEWFNSYGSPTLQYDAQKLKLKTTTNSQGQTILLGKYIY